MRELAGKMAFMTGGASASEVAGQVMSAMRDDELHVFTHSRPRWRAELEKRFGAILAAMDKAATAGVHNQRSSSVGERLVRLPRRIPASRQ